MKNYDGVALLSPVSFGYSRQSSHSATWFIGRTFQSVIRNAGLKKEDVDGFAVTSFSLGSDSVITLTQQFQITPRGSNNFHLEARRASSHYVELPEPSSVEMRRSLLV